MIDNLNCPACSYELWYYVDTSEPLTGIDPDGFECCSCGHVFILPGVKLEDLRLEKIEDGMIFKTHGSPNEASDI